MNRRLWWRLAAVVLLLAAALLLAHYTPIGEWLSRERLRATVAAAGVWGVPIYLGAFALALLLHVPATGIAFVGIAVAVFGRLAGCAVAYGGSILGVMISFVLVRTVGGTPLAAVTAPLVRRLLARIESHPLLTVFVLRLIFFAGAPVNYALALSTIPARVYLLGSALGMLPPVLVLGLLFDLVFR